MTSPDFACRFIILAACVLPLTLAGCAPEPAPPPGPQPVPHRRADPVGHDAPLAPLFQALDSFGTPEARTVAILQIGDSHTANDSFSGQMRTRFQARFGNAGRGYLQPGTPFKYYRPAQVSVAVNGFTEFTSYIAGSPGPYGIAATRAHADGPADATLTATDGFAIGAAEAEFATSPNGGSVQLVIPPAVPVTISTRGDGRPIFVHVPTGPGSPSYTLRALGDGPVDWLGWSVTHSNPGVIYSNLGFPGATVEIMDRWDWSIAQAEITHLHPAMIVLAYGTNEAFKPGLDPAQYAVTFANRLATLRQTAPYATLLVLGPPDAEHKYPRNAPNVVRCDATWAVPSRLGQIRAIEENAAHEAGAYWFDWAAPQGGTCGMVDWASRVPPLGGPDHVHMKTAGYAVTANVLFETLMHAFDRWRATAALE